MAESKNTLQTVVVFEALDCRTLAQDTFDGSGDDNRVDRVYVQCDWLDESIVDPLSRIRVVGTSLTYTTENGKTATFVGSLR